MFVSKLDPSGNVVFTTYIAGILGSAGRAITVDANGGIYVAGLGYSADFPTTASIQSAWNGALYLLKLSSDGSRLEYSTRITTAGAANAIAVDAAGGVYLAGVTGDGFPATPNAYQTEFVPGGGPPCSISPVNQDGFALEFAADGKTMLYSTYFGCGGSNRVWALAVGPGGNAYVGGTSLLKFDPTGSSVLWSPYIACGEVRAVTLDSSGNLFLAGGAQGTCFYTSLQAFQRTPPSYYGPLIDPRFTPLDADAFVMKFSSAGAILYSTLLGGRWQESGTALAVDGQGNALVAGFTASLDFPMLYPFQAPFSETSNGFLTMVNADGSALLYSTYLGNGSPFSAVGVGRGAAGEVIVAGSTTGAAGQVFVNRISESAPPPPAIYVDSVLNEASVVGGAIAPGEWINVVGVGFGQDSQLLLGGQAIPVTSISSTGILARVPDSFQTAGATTLGVVSGGLSSPTILVGTADAAPAIFTQDGSGFGQAMAFNADGSPNSPFNPAAIGTQIKIAVNGLGEIGAGKSVAAYFGCAYSTPATVETGPVPGLPGSAYTLVVTTIPTAACPSSGALSFGVVVDGINTWIDFQRNTTISISYVAPVAPTIAPNGVVSAASYQAGVVPNSWVTIFGTNLAPKTDDWSNAVVDGVLPTSLDNVTVTVGGYLAYVYFISPGQIDVLAPPITAGPVTVTVTTPGGTSNGIATTASVYGPACFLWPGNQVVATHQDYSLAAKAGTFSATTTVPAKPGETIILWATGFGPTNPVVQPGVVVPSDQIYATATLPSVTINGMLATVLGAALSPGSAGLYQIAIQVPDSLADGDWPVQASIGGAPSPTGPVLTVHR